MILDLRLAADRSADGKSRKRFGEQPAVWTGRLAGTVAGWNAVRNIRGGRNGMTRNFGYFLVHARFRTISGFEPLPDDFECQILGRAWNKEDLTESREVSIRRFTGTIAPFSNNFRCWLSAAMQFHCLANILYFPILRRFIRSKALFHDPDEQPREVQLARQRAILGSRLRSISGNSGH